MTNAVKRTADTARDFMRKLTPSERQAVLSEADDVRLEDRQTYAKNVLDHLRHAPRFQSIGRKLYVYVEDVAEALEQEMNA